LNPPRDGQHSIARTVVLHLLPGALIVAFYILAAPVVRYLGFPSLMTIFLAILFVLIPFELGYLFYRARESGASLGRIVLYREPVPKGQFVVLVLGLFVWSAICSVFVYPPLGTFFIENVFFWAPEWSFLEEDFARYSTVALLITWALRFIVNAIVGPIVEELYFRGYLLPRISRLGGVGAASQHGALFHLPLLHTLAEPRPHHWSPTYGLHCLVEEEHLREHRCACPRERF
jgi:membrane protease YdiL (CAAX protease family)